MRLLATRLKTVQKMLTMGEERAPAQAQQVPVQSQQKKTAVSVRSICRRVPDA